MSGTTKYALKIFEIYSGMELENSSNIKNAMEGKGVAIVPCLNCGGLISDKARKCVHCGNVFTSGKKELCAECGVELKDGMPFCDQCGCPVGIDYKEMSNNPRQIGALVINKANRGMKWTIMAVVVFAIVTVIVIGIICHKVQKEAEEAMRITQEQEVREENVRRIQEYAANLQLVTDTMLSGAADAENCCNLIIEVWNNAIWEKEDDATDRYTKPHGDFVADFNDALDNLFADSEFCLQIDNISENQRTVNSIVGQLKNPPEEYKSAYETLSVYYDAYLTLTNMAINPAGSLNTFSEDFSDADTEFIHGYHLMEFYLQD